MHAILVQLPLPQHIDEATVLEEIAVAKDVDGFSANVVAKFFGFLPGPPQFWTLSAAATQIAGAGLLSVGVFSRPVALSMSATMITAVIFHLLNTGGEAFPLGIPNLSQLGCAAHGDRLACTQP